MLTTCPQDGSALAPVALDGQAAPWLCTQCARGWYAAELSTAARLVYRPAYRDYAYNPDIYTAAVQEQLTSLIRGTSVQPGQLPLLTTAVLLQLWAQAGIAAGFVTQIAAVLKARGVTP